MASGAAASATILAFSGSLWLAFLAYPIVGTAALLCALVLVDLGGRRRHRPPTTGIHFAQFPVPRSTTRTVASRTLRSAANDSLRS
jgi:hypothetical protein